jgi:DNA polymerase III alpha subunit
MSLCHQEKLKIYMCAARVEGVKFDRLDINDLTHEFTVRKGRVVPGLQSIKGIGKVASKRMTELEGPFKDIDDVVEKAGKDKRVFERLIKLGAFDEIHENRCGLWMWYFYKYCTNVEAREFRKEIHKEYGWPEDKVLKRREELVAEYKQMNPKRRVPIKLLNWKPKIELTRDQVMSRYDDFTLRDRLEIEREYLGYYWSSPLELYHTKGYTIENAKIDGKVEGVVEKVDTKHSKKTNNPFHILHITDGIQTCDITIWHNVYKATDEKALEVGAGVRLWVDYNKDRDSFKIADNTAVFPLTKKEDGPEIDHEELCFVSEEDYPIW